MTGIGERLAAALANRYAVEREIGSGGMAVVLRARDLRHDRWVALKVLRPELSSTLGGERFLREIRLAAGLQHPHVLPLYDSGDAGGLLFYVMPYVEGESLRARLEREGQLPLHEALRIAREVADALAYAHQQDVVHRDIKPENILLSGGHAFVADFGIARAISAAGGLKLTEAGLAVGTPAYMSPEQVHPDSRIDGRADVYALGCVLYEMLAGEAPFRGPTAQSVMAQHSVTSVPLIRTVRPSVPPSVEAAIVKAMAKPAADRFTSAGSFAAELDGTTSAAHEIPSRTSRKLTMALLAVAIMLIGASWATVRWGAASSDEPISVAVAPIRVSDTSDTPFADGLTQELTTALTRIPRLAPRSYATVAVEAAKEKNPLELGRKLGVEYVLAAGLRRSRDHIRMTTELIRVADGTNVWSPRSFQGSDADLFRMQDSIASQLVRELAGNFSRQGAASVRRIDATPHPDAYKLYLQARAVPIISAEGSKTAVQLLTRAVERDPDFADAWAALASSYGSWAQYAGEPPSDLVRRMVDAANRAIALDSTNGEAWSTLGSISENLLWDFDRADREMRKAIEVSPSSGWHQIGYAASLHHKGKYDSAMALARRAVRLDPTNSHFVMVQAYQLQTAGRLREADSLARHALTLDSDNWVAHIMRGKIALKETRFDDAIRACQASERLQGSENPFSLGFAGYCYGKSGDRGNALRVLSALTEMSRRRYVERAVFVWPQLGLANGERALDELELSAGAREIDFLLLMRESAQDLWKEPRYQALLRRTGLDRYWKTPPVP